MKKNIERLLFLLVFLFLILFYENISHYRQPQVLSSQTKKMHWFMLYRKSNVEYLYFGSPQDEINSTLVKTFKVKTGIPGERPTPLPQLLNKQYWLIVDKQESFDNPETAPYFLTLNTPVGEEEPFGPSPYLECVDEVTGKKTQCNWILPGAFGLHGVGGDVSRLSEENPGSSGCIRHSDEDITYLYNLLDPKKEEIRYYIQDLFFDIIPIMQEIPPVVLYKDTLFGVVE